MRRSVRMVVATLAVAAVAGCGGGGGTKLLVAPSRDSLAAAADRTLEGGDYRMEFTQAFAAGDEGFTAEGTGEFDTDAGRVRMSMAMEMPGIGDQIVDIVMDGGTIYMKMGMFGDQWVKLDLDAVAPGVGDLFESGMTEDPSQFLAFLKGATDVEDLGREDVRGAETTHFAGSYSMGDAFDAMTDKQRKALENLMDEVPEEFLDTEVPFDAWVDDEGRVRRLDITMDVSALGEKVGGEGAMEMSMVMFDFGEDIVIDVPVGDDVMDFSELMDSVSS